MREENETRGSSDLLAQGCLDQAKPLLHHLPSRIRSLWLLKLSLFMRFAEMERSLEFMA